MLDNSKSIIDFLQEVPEVTTYLVIIVFALIVVIMMFTMLVSYNLNSDDSSISLDIEDSDGTYVIRKYEYSKDNYLFIYNTGMRICRSSVFISEYINNIISIKCSDNEQNRILYIKYEKDNDTICNEQVNCGNMSDLEYEKINKLITEYVKI